MAFITGSDLEYLKDRFDKELKGDVRLNLFTRARFENEGGEADQADSDEHEELHAAEAARVAGMILEELVAIDPDHLSLVKHDLDSEVGQQMAQQHGLDGEMLPVIVYESENLKGNSHYFGLPSGYEFGSMVENVVDLSSGAPSLKPKTVEGLATVNSAVQIMVFVTPT
jgi:hypothetical protein